MSTMEEIAKARGSNRNNRKRANARAARKANVSARSQTARGNPGKGLVHVPTSMSDIKAPRMGKGKLALAAGGAAALGGGGAYAYNRSRG